MNDVLNSGNLTFGRYELLERLGAGRVFEVFKAKSFGVEGFEKKVVIKRVHEELARRPDFLPIFIREGRRSVRLTHANVAQVFDLGSVDEGDASTYYMATEYVAGTDFATFLKRCREAGEVSIPLCLYVAAEAAKGLDHAHRRRNEQLTPLRITHGALAASNVLLSWDGDVKVSDFGMSHPLLASYPSLTASLRSLYAALSPEQANGEIPTFLSDVFSLGTLLYEAITGSHPFLVENAKQTLENVRGAFARPARELDPRITPELENLLARMLARSPQERPPSASHAYEELMACLYGLGTSFGQLELAEWLGTYRAPSTTFTGLIDAELTRPLTVHPQPVLSESDRPSLPPMAAFAETRHATALALTFGESTPPSQLLERAEDTLGRYGAHVVERNSKELVALFGLERLDGRDTETAVRAGLVLVREVSTGTMRPTVAVHSGRVRVDGTGQVDSTDDIVNMLLSRVRSIGGSVERRVVLSRRAAKNLRGRFELEHVDAGFLVGRPTQPRTRADRFVGRREELAELAEILAEASRGSLRMTAIVGDHGIGKTRLLDEVRRRLSRGTLDLGLFVAICSPRGRELPLSGIRAMIRRLCGVAEGDSADRIKAVVPRLRSLGLDAEEVDAALGQLGSAEGVGHMTTTSPLTSAVTQMFRALSDDRFQVFVWDDAQELDDASAQLLAGVATTLTTARIAFVFAARSDPYAPYKTLPLNAQIELGELEEEEAQRLLFLRLGVDDAPKEFVDFVLDRAGGHPMFIEELVREATAQHLVEVTNGAIRSMALESILSVPRTLRALLSGRVQRLPALERDIIVASSVLDNPARTRVLAAMLDRRFDEVEAAASMLESRGMVHREMPTAISFSTPLLRDVVLSELNPDAVNSLHEHAAEAYQRAFSDAMEEEAARIGYHLAAAGHFDRAADFYATSGLHFLGLRRLDRAVTDLSYALLMADLDERNGPQIGNWVRALATAVRHVHGAPELPSLVDRLAERLQTDSRFDARLRVQIAVDLALMLGAMDQYEAAVVLANEHTEAASRWPKAARSLLAVRAEMATAQGQIREALAALTRASELPANDNIEEHRLLVSLALARAGAGDTEGANAALARARNVDTESDAVLSCERLRASALILARGGQWRQAADMAVEASAEATALGLFYDATLSELLQVEAWIRLGELPRAADALDAARQLAEEVNAPRLIGQTRMFEACIKSLSDETEPAAPIEEFLHTAVAERWVWDALQAHFVLGRLAAHRGNDETAREHFSTCFEMAMEADCKVIADDCKAEMDVLDR